MPQPGVSSQPPAWCPRPYPTPSALKGGGLRPRVEEKGGGGTDRRPRTCRESSRNAAWKSCLSGAGRRLRLRRPGPAGAGAGALLSSRAAKGCILPGRGAGPHQGPRCTPGPPPPARRAAAGAVRWEKRWRAPGPPLAGGRRARAWRTERWAPPPCAAQRASAGTEDPSAALLRRPPLFPCPAPAETPPPSRLGVPQSSSPLPETARIQAAHT